MNTKHVRNRFKLKLNSVNNYQNYNKFRKFRDYLNYIKLRKQQLQRKRLNAKFNLNLALHNGYKRRPKPTANRFKLVNSNNNGNRRPTNANGKTGDTRLRTGPNAMPDCQYFVEGRCNSESCPYRHINVGSDAKICRHFNQGFCPNGNQCKHKHLFVVRKRDKTKIRTKCKPKSQSVNHKSVITRIQSANQCLTEHSLPHFIPISADTKSESINYKTDSNPFVANNCQQNSEPILTEQTVVTNNNTINRTVNRKDKYVWLESDDEISLDSEDTERLASCRPPITIVPNFLFG